MKATAERTWSVAVDHIGAPTELYDEVGELAWKMQLDVFGVPSFEVGTAEDCPWRLPGQYEDCETRSFYNWHRYYDYAEGRYISKDPLGIRPSTCDRAYPSDPLRSVDPLGLFFGSSTQVGYWTHDFQQELNQMYQSGDAHVRGNVAVVELSDGTRRAFASGAGEHSEQAMVAALREAGIEPSQVRRIYSELSPCLDRCLPALKEFLGDHARNVHLEFTWLHGLDPRSRAGRAQQAARTEAQRVRCGG